MSDKVFVRSLTCEQSNEILNRYDYDGWSVYSSLTDPDGEFGRREIRTTWFEESTGRLVEDVLPYPRGSGNCTHTEYRLREEEDDVEQDQV